MHLEPIDFDKLTFPPLVVGEYTEGPRSYPAVVPAWRDPELHGTGEGFDLRAMAVSYLWRGTDAPSDDVLAEVESFNADPRRGWALLIRAAAAPEVSRGSRKVAAATLTVAIRVCRLPRGHRAHLPPVRGWPRLNQRPRMACS